MDALAWTAGWTAAHRAEETRRADRLFEDSLARRLSGDRGRELRARMDAAMGAFSPADAIAVRTRWVDDRIAEAVSRGLRHIVLLGCGFDTRAWRLAWPADTTVYELDRAGVLSAKSILLEGVAEPRVGRRAVEADVTRHWERGLHAAGWRREPTLWVVEGLLMYLDQDQVSTLLDRIGTESVSGSELVTDVVGQSLLDHPGLGPGLRELAAQGIAWRFGTDQPAELLGARGWAAEITTLAEAARGYGRWPRVEMPDEPNVVPRSYLVHASRT